MKIKTNFRILMACAILIPAIVVGIVGSMQYRSYYTTDAKNRTTYSAINASIAVREFFSNHAAELSALTASEEVQTAAAGDYTPVKTTINKIIKNEAKNSYLLDFVILDSNGLVIAGSNETNVEKTFFCFGDDLKETPVDSYYISPIYIDSEKYFKSVIVIAKPLTDINGNKAYIARVLSVDSLAIFLRSCVFLDGQGRLVLIDPNGNGINYVAGSVTRSTELNNQDVTAVKTAYINGTAVPAENSYYRLEAGDSMGAYGSIGSSQWIWMAIYPASIVEADMSEVVMQGLIIFAIFAVVCAVIAFLLVRFMTAPMKKMVKAINQIRDGDPEHRLPDCKPYELAEITDIFNEMMDNAYISEEIHHTTSNLSENMLFEWSLDENRMYASDEFIATFPLDIDKVNLMDGTFIDSLMNDKDSVKYRRDLSALLNGNKEHIEMETKIKTRNGMEAWFSLRAKAIVSRNGEFTRVIGVVTDITSEKMQNLSLAQRASFDFLSQLYNRSTFMREVQTKLEARRANEEYAILFIDVDDFKFINDRYGHNVGDEVIKFVSDTLKDKIGENGFAGRFGGDEFVICMTNSALIPEVDNFAMDIIDLLYQGYHCQTETFDTILNVKASVGISIAPTHSNTAEKLVGMADEAMYFVKKNGKSNYHIYDASDAADPNLENTLA